MLLVVGCKLGEIATKRFTIPPKGKAVIHLDIEPEEFGRTMGRGALWGDVREGAARSGCCSGGRCRAARVGAGGLCRRALPSACGLEGRRDGAPDLERDADQRGRMMHELNGAMPADGILVADGGFAAHWAGLLYDTKQAGRGFVPDRGFASIGYGLPGAIGAALAGKGRPVVVADGRRRVQHVAGRARDGETHGRSRSPWSSSTTPHPGYVKALQHLIYGEGTYQSSDLAETNYAESRRGDGLCRHPRRGSRRIGRAPFAGVWQPTPARR